MECLIFDFTWRNINEHPNYSKFNRSIKAPVVQEPIFYFHVFFSCALRTYFKSHFHHLILQLFEFLLTIVGSRKFVKVCQPKHPVAVRYFFCCYFFHVVYLRICPCRL